MNEYEKSPIGEQDSLVQNDSHFDSTSGTATLPPPDADSRHAQQEAANNSTHVLQLKALQEGINGSAQVRQFRALQEVANQSPATASSREAQRIADSSPQVEQLKELQASIDRGNEQEGKEAVPAEAAASENAEAISEESAASEDEATLDEAAKEAYKNYVNELVNRTNSYTGMAYKDDPAIMAWELINEPRAESDPTNEILVAWANEMSSYIKSLDDKHLIALGSEGFFNREHSNWAYNGYSGVDWEAILALANIDYGTVHLYPEHLQLYLEHLHLN